MLKKMVYGIVAASFVFAAQGASANDAQFWTGERYQGVTALPFDAFSPDAKALRGRVKPDGTPQAQVIVASQPAAFPAPYDKGGGYFN